jgi:hypothetical protein
MGKRSTMEPSDRLLDLLIEQVGGDNRDEILTAARLLVGVGPPVAGAVIAHAARTETSILHRYRLLDLAEGIGGRRSPQATQHLRSLLGHQCPVIRQKAESLLASP